MRISIVTVLLFFVVFTSCDSVKITKTNYMYEGELYAAYLNNELAVVNDQILQLQDSLDNNQGDQQTQGLLAQAIQKKDELSVDLSSIPDIVNIGIIPPKPPCPNGDLCFPPELTYLLVASETEVSKFTIKDPGGNTIGSASSTKNGAVPNTQEQLFYHNIEVSSYTGTVTVIVERTNADGNTVVYSVLANKN